MHSIGMLSQQTGVSTETIRYYERIALLPQPRRAGNGYRLYNETDVERLQFIRRSRALDFGIDEIREILAFRERQEPPCQYVMSVMQNRVAEIEARIQDLERLRDELKSLHHAGKQLPEDVQMKTCVCHLIQVSGENQSGGIHMSELEKTTELIRARRGQDVPLESARFYLAYTRLLAEGKPVSAHRLAEAVGEPIEFVTTAFHQMQESGAEFNDRGELIGAALTHTSTRHQVEVDGVTMYAWCALDTMFLPAYIGKAVQVSSTCPVTNSPISLTIAPDGIEGFTPTKTVLSIVTDQECSSGIDGTFCSQVNFFASKDAAREWIGARSDFSILTVPEAYELAQQIYIEPVMKYA